MDVLSEEQKDKQQNQLDTQRRLQRRRFLKIALPLGAATAAMIYFAPLLFPSPVSKKESGLSTLSEGVSSSRLDEFAKNIASGGPPKDGIPPIDNPRYVSSDKADAFLSKNDVVFGLEHNETVKAYPQIILVWHEIVNDLIGGEKVSITYCPLTGSTVGYVGKSRVDGEELTFGTTGKLVNSNLLMYDRQSDSNWPQVLGVAINGPSKGNVLQQIPMEWTTWEKWKKKHPDTQVLSTDTGYSRSYGTDPYGSYTTASGYYFSNSLFFSVMAMDERFQPKKVVIGLKVGDSYLAVPKEEIAVKKFDNIAVGTEPIVLFYDPELDVVRAYSRGVGSQTLKFSIDNSRVVDQQTSSEWTPSGLCTKGRFAGTQLKRMEHFDVMWFAWYAFYPNTEAYA